MAEEEASIRGRRPLFHGRLAGRILFSLAPAGGGVHNLSMKTAILIEDLVGTYRRFGHEGPVYQVLKESGEGMVKIVVVETGEKLDYPQEQALADPEAD
jgi:hypothetical protein